MKDVFRRGFRHELREKFLLTEDACGSVLYDVRMDTPAPKINHRTSLPGQATEFVENVEEIDRVTIDLHSPDVMRLNSIASPRSLGTGRSSAVATIRFVDVGRQYAPR